MPKPLGYLPPLNPAGAIAPAGSLPIAAPPPQAQMPAPQIPPPVVVPAPPAAPTPYAQPAGTGHAQADAILAAAHANGVVGWNPAPAPTIAPPPKPAAPPPPPAIDAPPLGDTPPLAGEAAQNRFSAAAQSLVGEYCGPAGCARAVDKIAKLAGVPVPKTENAGEFERQLGQTGSGWVQVPASEADTAQIVTMKGAGGKNNPSGRHIEVHIGGGRTVGDPGRSSGYKIRAGAVPKNDPTAKFWKFTGDMTGPVRKSNLSTQVNQYGEPGAKPSLLHNEYGEPTNTVAQQLAAGAHHSQAQPRKTDGTFRKGKKFVPKVPAPAPPRGNTSFQDWLNNAGEVIKAGASAFPEIGADIAHGANLFPHEIVKDVKALPGVMQNLAQQTGEAVNKSWYDSTPTFGSAYDKDLLDKAGSKPPPPDILGIAAAGEALKRSGSAPGDFMDKLFGPSSLPAQVSESMAKHPVLTTIAIAGGFKGASGLLESGAAVAEGSGNSVLASTLRANAASAKFFADPLDVSGVIKQVATKVKTSARSASFKAQPGDFVQSGKNQQTVYGRVVGVTGKGPTKSYVIETPTGTKKVPWHDIVRHAPAADMDAIVAAHPGMERLFGMKNGTGGYKFKPTPTESTPSPQAPEAPPRLLTAPEEAPPAAPTPVAQAAAPMPPPAPIAPEPIVPSPPPVAPPAPVLPPVQAAPPPAEVAPAPVEAPPVAPAPVAAPEAPVQMPAAPAAPAPAAPDPGTRWPQGTTPLKLASTKNSATLQAPPTGIFEPTSSKVFTTTSTMRNGGDKHTQAFVLVGKAGKTATDGVQPTHIVVAAKTGAGASAPSANEPIWSVYPVDAAGKTKIPNTSYGLGEPVGTDLSRKEAITLAKSLSGKSEHGFKPAPAASSAPPAVTPEAQAAAKAYREKQAAPETPAPTLPPHTRTLPGAAPADIMPPKATVAKAKGEKINAQTGMTPTQSKFLVGALQEAMPKLPEKAQTGQRVDKQRKAIGDRYTLPADTNVTIQVPDDGRFTIGGKDQAKALIDKISKPSAVTPRKFDNRKPHKDPNPEDPGFDAHYHNTQEILRAKQAAGKAFQSRQKDGSVKIVEGSPITVPAAPDHNFFTFEEGNHYIVEMSTGLQAGEGDTKALALEDAEKNIKNVHQVQSGGFAETIKKGRRDPNTLEMREPLNQEYQPKPAAKAGAPKPGAPVAAKPLPKGQHVPTDAEEIKAAAAKVASDEEGSMKITPLPPGFGARAVRSAGDFITEAKNFTSNLNMTKKYGTRKLMAKVYRLASFKARAAVLMQGAYGQIAKQMPRNTNSGEFFNMVMIESQLRGIRERWEGLSQEAGNVPDAALMDTKTLPDGSTVTRMAGIWKVPIEALSGTRKQYRGLDDEANRLAMDGDVDGLRKLLAKAFEDAADTTGTMPLKPGEFDAAMQDPAFQKALAIWKRDFASELATTHASNEGVFRTNFGPAGSYYPLIRADENGEPIYAPTSGGEFGQPKNTQNNFATGQSENYDYSVKGLSNNVRGALKRNAQADMMRQLEAEDLLQPTGNVKVTKAKTPHEQDKRTIEIRGHEYPAVVVSTSKPRMVVSDQGMISIGAKQMAAPSWLVREMGPLLHTSLPEWGGTPIGMPEPIRKVINAINNTALIAGPEAIYHTKNLLSTAISEVIPEGLMGKILGGTPMSKASVTVAQIANTNPMSDENLANLREMAEAGVIPDRYGNETRDKLISEVTGAHLNRISLAPELFGRTGVDIRSRLYAWRQAKASFGLDPDAPLARDAEGEFADPKMALEMAERVSHFGVYNRALEGSLQRFLKDTGMGPWATAATTMTRNGVRLWYNAIHFKDVPGGSTGQRVAASVYLKISAGIPGLVTFWALWHHQATGKWPWEDRNSRLLEIPISRQTQTSDWGKKVLPQHGRVYINVAGIFNPLAGRGASALGIQGAYDTYQRTHYAPAAQEAAMRGPINAGLHIAVGGPFASNAFRSVTGDEPYMTSMTQGKGRRQRVGGEFMTMSHDYAPHGAYPQLQVRGETALGNLNSFVHMYAEGDDNPALKDSNKVAAAVFQLSGTLKTERPSGGRLRGGMGVGSMKTKL